MASSSHLALLERGIVAWNEWRKEEPEAVPDLSGAQLVGADLAGYDLVEANLEGANLSRSNLGSSLLIRANLEGARLERAFLGPGDLFRKMKAGEALGSEPGTLLVILSAVLSEARLVGADLSNAYLSRCDLSCANLHKANLRSGLLFGADLRCADLSEANADGADLSAALLDQVDFQGADLGAVNFVGASLRGANLTDARLIYTILGNNDLREVLGLERVRHDGPSTIGIDTLEKSAGKIPRKFLRSAGLSELLIDHFVGASKSHYSCFISYSHGDKAFAQRLHKELQGRGIRCWLDEHQMLPGDDFYDQIQRGVDGWDKVLLCCSEASLRSWWVDNEIESAFAKERKLTQERGEKVLVLIPLDLDGIMLGDGWTSGKAAQVRSRLAADFTGWEMSDQKFQRGCEAVNRALRTKESGRESKPRSRL